MTPFEVPIKIPELILKAEDISSYSSQTKNINSILPLLKLILRMDFLVITNCF